MAVSFERLEEQVRELTVSGNREEFIYDFLLVYGISKATVTRAKTSRIRRAENQVIIKQKVFFEAVKKGETASGRLAELKADSKTFTNAPRFIIATDFKDFAAFDTKTQEEIAVPFKELSAQTEFFYPWAGRERYQVHQENPADTKAAEKMASLYDELVKANPALVRENPHALNVFLTRLLFCFFAEDTGIFESANAFTKVYSEHTDPSGKDSAAYLTKIFESFDAKNKGAYPHCLQEFPYVNGRLFTERFPVPVISSKARRLMIECGELDWKMINPDIFGSMFQAVTNPEVRGGLGQHYTSVPNIMKVIEPLFLNDLREEFEKAKNDPKKLKVLWERIGRICIFDPACGSGNFLIIAYKQLRLLELDILKQLKKLNNAISLSNFSWIRLENFYGLEIDDFACEIATLSLWLAEHQMNAIYKNDLGTVIPTLPLKPSGQIKCANALRTDWTKFCPRQDEKGNNLEIYVLGNPPFHGTENRTDEQKKDLENVFAGKKNIKNLDYVTCWFYLAAKYIADYPQIKFAFVATNSICQGEQVGYLWPHIFAYPVEIFFAHQSFKWSNNAKHNAGVTCVIVGMANKSKKQKKVIYTSSKFVAANNISPYLRTDSSDEIIQPRSKNISDLPVMKKGNIPCDGGNLILSTAEKNSLIAKYPQLEKYIRLLQGSKEYIYNLQRWCLWLNEKEANEIEHIPEIAHRFQAVYDMRIKSSKKATREFASRPYRFMEIRHSETGAIIVPSHSSENRDYVPIGFLGPDVILTNATLAIYDAPLWLMGMLTSRIHMVWMRYVVGRLESRYRYSTELCYNTFPFPKITAAQKKEIEKGVNLILAERAKGIGKTLAQLYNRDTMPEGLRQAHQAMDEIIDRCYQAKPFANDEERLAKLFALYRQMTGEKE